jgi:hypothetical protein
MSTAEILKAAKALIADPERWTVREYAIKADSSPAWGYETDACKWCALGALQYVLLSRVTGGTQPRLLLDSVANGLHDEGVTGVNDDLGHAAVMRMYDKAIELAEERQ